MQNGIELRRRPQIFVCNLLELVLVRELEYAVARDVVPGFGDVIADLAEEVAVVDSGGLEERREVVGGEGAVGATVAGTMDQYVWAGDGESIVGKWRRLTFAQRRAWLL